MRGKSACLLTDAILLPSAASNELPDSLRSLRMVGSSTSRVIWSTSCAHFFRSDLHFLGCDIKTRG